MCVCINSHQPEKRCFADRLLIEVQFPRHSITRTHLNDKYRDLQSIVYLYLFIVHTKSSIMFTIDKLENINSNVPTVKLGTILFSESLWSKSNRATASHECTFTSISHFLFSSHHIPETLSSLGHECQETSDNFFLYNLHDSLRFSDAAKKRGDGQKKKSTANGGIETWGCQ